MQQPDELRIIVSCGGTGGHIFPAIAIANAIKSRRPDAKFLFVGAEGRMEMEKVPAAGFEIEGLWISGLQRKLTRENLAFPFKVISSFLKARKIIRRFGPHVAVGTGGYASWPTLQAASRAGIPSLIQEQNSFPGIANKKLAGSVDVICVAYEGMEKFFRKDKIRLYGNPVRKEITAALPQRSGACTKLGLSPGKPVLLVVGGSLGARTINQSIASGLQQFADAGIQVIWQTGKSWAETASSLVKPFSGKGIVTMPFIQEMEVAYAAADMVISRAGAIAISELCVIGKPVILVPSPNVTEDHQTKNAQALTAEHAAIMISDAEAAASLVSCVISTMNDEQLRSVLSTNIRKLARPGAADAIAEEVISLASRKSKVKV